MLLYRLSFSASDCLWAELKLLFARGSHIFTRRAAGSDIGGHLKRSCCIVCIASQMHMAEDIKAGFRILIHSTSTLQISIGFAPVFPRPGLGIVSYSDNSMFAQTFSYRMVSPIRVLCMNLLTHVRKHLDSSSFAASSRSGMSATIFTRCPSSRP